MKMHDETRRYRCLLCNFNFERLHILKNHLTKHTTDKKLKCDQCDVKVQKQSMNEHVKRVHEKVKNHFCSDCDQTFFKKHNLDVNIKTPI